MEDSITVRIYNSSPLNTGLVIVFSVVFLVGMDALTRDFTTSGLIIWLLLWVPLLILLILASKRQTVIRCNENRLTWRHLWKTHTVELYEIKAMRCEPYEMRSRYSSHLRIALIIELDSSIGIEPDTVKFDVAVKASALLDEKLGGKKTDIPLVQLYQFLRAHVPESE
jgi:hypothetical protein